MKTVPGFVLIEVKVEDMWQKQGSVYVPVVKTDVEEGVVVAVGEPTYGWDGKYYDTSEVKVGDRVLFYTGNSVRYDRTESYLWKVPIHDVLCVLEPE